jgi:hypothetical protein
MYHYQKKIFEEVNAINEASEAWTPSPVRGIMSQPISGWKTELRTAKGFGGAPYGHQVYFLRHDGKGNFTVYHGDTLGKSVHPSSLKNPVGTFKSKEDAMAGAKKDAASLHREEVEVSEAWWNSSILNKKDADSLISDLESAYKKGGLRAQFKVPNGDSGPLWDMIEGLTEFLRTEPKNMVAYVLKGVKDFLSPSDRNDPRIKKVFESVTEDGEEITEDKIPFKKILKDVKDIQGPFTIVVMRADGPGAMMQQKVSGAAAIPAHIMHMLKELKGKRWKAIAIENSTGKIVNVLHPKDVVREEVEEDGEIAEQFKAGDKVKVPHKGKMVSGKIVRFDDGGTSKAQQHGGGYVVDVGEPASILVPKQKVQKEEVESVEEATSTYPSTQLSKSTKRDYAAREAEAKEIAKKILQVAKERGVRVYTDGKRVVSCTKDFPKGDMGAFHKAYNDCGMVLTHMRFTKNSNQWGCSSAGFGVGAQECVKAGRAQQHKSGDGGSLIIKFLKV